MATRRELLRKHECSRKNYSTHVGCEFESDLVRQSRPWLQASTQGTQIPRKSRVTSIYDSKSNTSKSISRFPCGMSSNKHALYEASRHRVTLVTKIKISWARVPRSTDIAPTQGNVDTRQAKGIAGCATIIHSYTACVSVVQPF